MLFRSNVAVAQVYALVNQLTEAAGNGSDGMAWATRETATLLVHAIGPMMPHLGEQCWARLGNHTLLAETPWPEPEKALLVDDTVTIAVQVNGKRRDELVLPRTASKEVIEAEALKLDSVARALAGKKPTKVIVVPQRIVNVVA